MEEKERYVIRYDLDYNQCLIDTEENQGVGDYIQIVKLLNQQDKRIKELEQENQQLKLQLKDLEESYNKTMRYLNNTRSELLNLPKKIMEEIKANNIYLNSSKPNQKGHIYDSYLIEAKTLNAILKKYGGEENGKSNM